MARARAIDTRLEKLIPATEEYIVTGIYTAAEVKEIIRRRTDDEYRLVARPLLILDVRKAIAFEHEMELKIGAYCSRSKVNLKHRWSVVERMEQIYKIGLKHLKHPGEREALRHEMVAFLKRYNRTSSLASHYAELVVKHPLNASYWTEAALYANETGEIDNARISVQHAIRLLPNSEDVYACALSIELTFAQKIVRAAVAEHQERVERLNRTLAVGAASPIVDPVERMRTENAALYQIVVELALCRVIVDEVVSRPEACTPDLVLRLCKLALSFPFGRALAVYILQSSITKRLLPALGLRMQADESSSSGHVHKLSAEEWYRRWTTGPRGAEVIAALIDLDIQCCLTSRAKRPISDVETYLRDECHQGSTRRAKPKTAQLREAVAQCIVNAVAMLYGFSAGESDVDHAFLRFVAPALQEKIISVWLPVRDEIAVRRKPDEKEIPSVLHVDVQRTAAELIVGMAIKNHSSGSSEAHDESLGSKLVRVCAVIATVDTDVDSMSGEALKLVQSITATSLDTLSTMVPRSVHWTPALVLQILSPQSLPGLGVVEPLGNSGPRVFTKKTMEEEIAWLLSMLQSGQKENVVSGLWEYLVEKLALPLASEDDASFVNWTPSKVLKRFPVAFSLDALQRVPIGLWQLFLMAEEAAPTQPAAVSVHATHSNTDSSDSDDEGEPVARKRLRVDPKSFESPLLRDSYGALGLKFLACHVHAKLSESEQVLRAEGIYQITLHVMSHIFECASTEDFSRDVVCGRLSADSDPAALSRVRAAESLMHCVSAMSPLPRQVLTAVDIPLREGIFLWQRESKQSKAAVASSRQAAVNAHERALAHYQLATRATGTTTRVHEHSPVINAIYRDHFAAVEVACDTDAAIQKHVRQYASTAELNAQDWKQFVTFARSIDGDLLFAQKLVARSKMEAVDSRCTGIAVAAIK